MEVEDNYHRPSQQKSVDNKGNCARIEGAAEIWTPKDGNSKAIIYRIKQQT